MTATADTIAICDTHEGAGGPGRAASDEFLVLAERSARKLRGRSSPRRFATHLDMAGVVAC